MGLVTGGVVFGYRLQWGRGLGAAECAFLVGLRSRESLLQWGRGLGAAECRRNMASILGYDETSMGPRLRSRGMVGAGNEPVHECSTSMGPRLRSRGMCSIERTRALRQRQTSMGPRLRSRGMDVVLRAVEVGEVNTSMGPRLRSRGMGT